VAPFSGSGHFLGVDLSQGSPVVDSLAIRFLSRVVRFAAAAAAAAAAAVERVSQVLQEQE